MDWRVGIRLRHLYQLLFQQFEYRHESYHDPLPPFADIEKIRELSAAVHDTRWRAAALGAAVSGPVQAHLEQALWRLLRAETSCNIFWGEAWVDRAERDLDEAARALTQAKAGLETESEDVGC